MSCLWPLCVCVGYRHLTWLLIVAESSLDPTSKLLLLSLLTQLVACTYCSQAYYLNLCSSPLLLFTDLPYDVSSLGHTSGTR